MNTVEFVVFILSLYNNELFCDFNWVCLNGFGHVVQTQGCHLSKGLIEMISFSKSDVLGIKSPKDVKDIKNYLLNGFMK